MAELMRETTSAAFFYTHTTHVHSTTNFLQYRHYYLQKLKYNLLFSEISKQNDDHSDTLNFEWGLSMGSEGGHIFHFGGP